ncbi:hypothetical protein EK21DRAFT_70342, partial [Setomelanomma holmii]
TPFFDDFTKERTLYTPGLRGCTVLAIISRKGVFLGHYWESKSFSPDDGERLPLTDGKKETDDQVWDRTVKKGLTDGINIKGEGVPQQKSLTELAKNFRDDDIKAYIIRPRKSQAQEVAEEAGASPEPEAKWGYPERWDEMRTIVEDLIPKVKRPGGWNVRIYDAVSGEDADDLLEKISQGRVLFKFDPTHGGTRRKPVRRAMLWSEQLELHSDEWDG